MQTKLEIKQTDEDLTVYPAERETATSRIIAVGDLHGNAMKFVYILLRNGIMDMPEPDFKALSDGYNKNTDDLTEGDLEQFETIINRATIVKPGLLICIGDEFADRGKNDFFTALVFKKLHDSGVPYKIHLSNHGLYLISYLEYLEWSAMHTTEALTLPGIMNKLKLLQPLDEVEQGLVPHLPIMSICPLLEGQMNSLKSLMKLQKKFPQLNAKFNELVNEAYLDHLALLGYLRLDKGHFYLFSHAPIDQPILDGLANTLLEQTDVPDYSSTEGMIALIDQINAGVMNLIKIKQFSSSLLVNWYSDQQRAQQRIDISKLADPVMQVLWNREPKGCLQDNIINVHGHTGPEARFMNSINLDSHWGKPAEMKYGRDVKGERVFLGTIPASNQDVCDIISQPADKTCKMGDYYSDAVLNEPAYATSSSSAEPYSSQIYKKEVVLQKTKHNSVVDVDLENTDTDNPKRQKLNNVIVPPARSK